MLQHDSHHHARREPQVHGRPDMGSEPANITPTPTSSSATDMTSTTSTSTMSNSDPVFVYPTAVLTFNNIDVVQVGYQTSWDSVNLTVFCEMSAGSNEFALAKINQIKPDGTYAIAPIQAGMQIPKFPANCNFMIGDAKNSTDYTTGAGFTMVSTQGAATTYGLATTGVVVATTSPSGTHKSTTSSGTTTKDAAPTSAAALSSSTTTQTALSESSKSNGPSSGAKAGIALGVIIGVLILAAAAYFLYRMKRRMDKLETMVTLRSTASSVEVAPAEKPSAGESTAKRLPPIPSPSPPPDSGCMPVPRIEVFKIGENHRNSEDWRRFFGSGQDKETAPS